MAFVLPDTVSPSGLIESAWGNEVVAALAELRARHVCRLTDVGQTLAATSTTLIAWGTEVEDTDGYHAAGSATISVPSVDLAGSYIMSGRFVRAAGNWSGGYGLISAAGSTYYFAPPATDRFAWTLAVDLASGDAVTVSAFNNSTATTVDSTFNMYRIPTA